MDSRKSLEISELRRESFVRERGSLVNERDIFVTLNVVWLMLTEINLEG